MKKLTTAFSFSLAAIVGLQLLGIAQQQNLPPHVAGKLVNISHQKVKVGNTWQDQVEVTVDSCQTPGQLKTVRYTPSNESDRSALGHLFHEDIHSARTADLKQQQLPNGYGVFWVDTNNKVLRTGLLGSKLDCRQVPTILGQFQ